MGSSFGAPGSPCQCKGSEPDALDVPGHDDSFADPSETVVFSPFNAPRSATDSKPTAAVEATRKTSTDVGQSAVTPRSGCLDASDRSMPSVPSSDAGEVLESIYTVDASIPSPCETSESEQQRETTEMSGVDSSPIILELDQESVTEEADLSEVQSIRSFGDSVVSCQELSLSETPRGDSEQGDGKESPRSRPSSPKGEARHKKKKRSTKTIIMERNLRTSQLVSLQVSCAMQSNIRTCYNIKGKAYESCGAMGSLRKAVGKVSGALRVVKTLAAKDAQKLEEHISILRTFDHPNIMMLHEVFEDTKHMYLLLDYCSNSTLADRFAAVAAEEIVSSEVQGSLIMRQILRAVSYMHENLVCHRDLAPNNILFTSTPPTRTIDARTLLKVAALKSQCCITEHMTGICGSTGYMAPEMVAKLYTKACDLWSCGAILFELLFGCVPSLTGEDCLSLRPKKSKAAKFTSTGGHTYTLAAKDIGTSPRTDSPKSTDRNQDLALKATTISEDGRDLCNNMLRVDAKARHTAYQALHHKWMNKGQSKLKYAAMRIDVIEQLKMFRNLNKFKQASLRLMAAILSEEQTAEARKIFLSLDLDGDGMLSMAEFQARIKADPKLCKDYSDEVIQRLFSCDNATDQNFHKNFSYMEFLAATFDRKKSLNDGILRVAFDCFDKNGDGEISISELAVGHNLGALSLEELGRAIEDLDDNGDNNIDFDEFSKMMKQQSALPPNDD